LQRVLQLRQTPRFCFVLRVLEGWPREKCAIALGIPADTVDAEVCNAAQALAFWGQ
jgi:DNA-directed RNA polymerase specialized sigma24 family protein